jgi:hypothetical protein
VRHAPRRLAERLGALGLEGARAALGQLARHHRHAPAQHAELRRAARRRLARDRRAALHEPRPPHELLQRARELPTQVPGGARRHEGEQHAEQHAAADDQLHEPRREVGELPREAERCVELLRVRLHRGPVGGGACAAPRHGQRARSGLAGLLPGGAPDSSGSARHAAPAQTAVSSTEGVTAKRRRTANRRAR